MTVVTNTPETTPSGDPSKPTKTRKKGRPRKSEVAGKRPVGRPKGEGAVMQEYKRRMLARPDSAKVLDSIYKAALDDEHKNQAVAWKIVVDRILPVAIFEQDIKRSGGKSSVSVTINGVDTKRSVTIDDGEFEEV